MLEFPNVLEAVNAHLERTGEAPAAFGRRVANDPRLIFDLRAGRSVGTGLLKRIVDAINEREAVGGGE